MKSPTDNLFTLVATVALMGLGAQAAVPQWGTYNGLFQEPENVWQQSSGTLTLTATSRGRFSGKLLLGPSRYSFSGAFDSQGHAVVTAPRRNQSPLRLDLLVTADDEDVISGTVSDGSWTADFFMDRAIYNGKSSLSPDFGQYTMIIPGDFTATEDPGGDGYGTITVSKNGQLRFAGALADGTKVTQASAVSKRGEWPFYNSVYRGGGAIWGWVLLNQTADEPLNGDVTWVRPEMSGSYYPAGFAIVSSTWGSYYAKPPKGTKILNIDDGLIEFNGGNLLEGITNQVVVEINNRVTNLSANGLKMSFSTSNGLFSGKVQHPVSFEWIKFNGVVLQDYGVAAGFFLDWNQSGEVWLQQKE